MAKQGCGWKPHTWASPVIQVDYMSAGSYLLPILKALGGLLYASASLWRS
jgi:hypothetical protein